MDIFILHLETATTICSVALSKNGEVIACKEIDDGYRHAELLTIFIQNVLKEAEIQPVHLKAISLDIGPGSYTGLRIGAGVAKGLAYGLSLPVIGINSMHALYLKALQNNKYKEGFYIPMLDARRMEVYTCIFNHMGKQLTPIQPMIVNENSFIDSLKTDLCYFFGNANEKVSNAVKHVNALFLDINLSSAIQAKYAFDKFLEKDFLNTAYFEPIYLKSFGER